MTPNLVLVSVCLPGQLERSQDARVDFLPSLEEVRHWGALPTLY